MMKDGDWIEAFKKPGNMGIDAEAEAGWRYDHFDPPRQGQQPKVVIVSSSLANSGIQQTAGGIRLQDTTI